jgi:streptogramin lyase
MRRFVTSLVVAVASFGVIGFAGPATAASSRHCTFPASIPLPNLPQQPGGWRPEGLTIGRGTSFYVGSLADGAVFRGDLCTGRGGVLVAGTPGTAKTGLKVDRWNRLWAAGAGGGDAWVYDAATGAPLAHFRFTDQTATFINDLVVTQRAVYFTDSQQPVLYMVPLGRHGALPDQTAVRALPLSGPAAEAGGFNNGIVATPHGELIVVQSRLGRLVSVDPDTGASAVVDLGGYSVLNGDGLVLRGHMLYVVRNRDNLVAVFRFGRSFDSATLVREITSPLFRVPSTADLFGPYLYAVNARFGTMPPPTDFDVVRVPA